MFFLSLLLADRIDVTQIFARPVLSFGFNILTKELKNLYSAVNPLITTLKYLWISFSKFKTKAITKNVPSARELSSGQAYLSYIRCFLMLS